MRFYSISISDENAIEKIMSDIVKQALRIKLSKKELNKYDKVSDIKSQKSLKSFKLQDSRSS